MSDSDHQCVVVLPSVCRTMSAQTAVRACNTVTDFKVVWKAFSGQSVSDMHLFYAFRSEFAFDGLEAMLKEAVPAMLRFTSDLSTIGAFMFHFSAFSLGRGIGYETICVLMGAIHGMFQRQDALDFAVWLRFFSWMLVGHYYRIPSEDEPRRWASKFLSLAEFHAGTAYEAVSDKDARSVAVFVSHRWATPEHPDADGAQKALLLSLLRPAQQFLDWLWDPACHTYQESDFGDSQGHVFNTIFDGVLRWAPLVFARTQRQMLVWYDHQSIPQSQTIEAKTQRERCLTEIDALAAEMPVLALAHDDFFQRGWCFFECLQSMMSSKELLFHCNGVVSANMGTLQRQIVSHVYGCFCSLIERGSAPSSDLFAEIGLRCTNGSDLAFLSAQMAEKSSRALAYTRAGLVAHPFLTAWRWFMERHVAPSWAGRNWDPLMQFLMFQKHKALESVPDADVDTFENIKRMPVIQLRYNYPDVGVAFLVETKTDWDGAADFEAQSTQCFEYMVRVADITKDCSNSIDFSKQFGRQFMAEFESLLASVRGFKVKLQKKEQS